MAIAGTLTYKTDLDTSGVKKAGSTVKSIIAGLGITKMISKAMSTISSSLDGAISRFDTLNNFPKVMSNLGISAKDSEKAIKKMADKLSGLPTTLDQGAMAVQRFTSKNGDVAKSTDIFLALNNAILAGGASTEIQAQALEQMAQAYAKGKPDMMEWRSIMTAMPAQLNQVAQAMGYGKNGADDLGEALRHGDVSMNKFMNTIVKLNTKGAKGFQNFEQQARNATGGVQTAIVVAKTQIVKGLTTIIDNIDKSLKKSGTSINKIIADLGNRARKVLENIGKTLGKIDFVGIFNTLSKLLPLIISVTTAWLAYNLALKAMALINIVSTIGSTVVAFIKLIPAIKSAKDAMTLLNITLNANPLGVVIGLVTALATALAIFKGKTDNSTDALKQLEKQLEAEEKALDEQTQKVNDNHDAWANLQKEKQNSINAGMTELNHYQNLYKELTRIVDKNGKVKKGYEERAKFITSQLSDALGIEIKMSNGVVQNYDKLAKSIKEVIKQKKAEIILSAQEEEYKEAIKNTNDAYRERQKISAKLEEEDKKRKELLAQLEQAEKEQAENRKKRNFSLVAEKDATIDILKQQIAKSDERTNKLKKNYKTQQEVIESYSYAIGTYEKNMEYAHKGQVDKMITTNWELEKSYKATGDEIKARLEDEIEYLKEKLKTDKRLRKETGSDIYDQQIKDGEALLKQKQDELAAHIEVTKTGLNEVEHEWNDNFKKVITNATGKKIEFKKLANGQVQMYVDGIKAGKPKTSKEMSDLVTKAINEVKSGKSDAKTAGENLIDGVKQGVSNQNKQNSVYSSIRNFGMNILDKLKSSLKEKSPSKATREMGGFLLEGVSLGIKDEEKNTLKDVNNFGKNVLEELSSSMDMSKQLEDMYKEMNKTIQMENAKLNFDVMSNNAYNRTMQLPAIIDLSANFEGTVPVQLNLDGEKIYDNQQKISVRKSIQYGGVK